jgi:dTDP-4-dehydrorhamnose reductase
MKWLITGANGQLGRSFQEILTGQGFEYIALSKSELDISDAALTKDLISELKPSVVINAAAYTNVEKAESEQDSAFGINKVGAANIAIASKCIGAKLIHFSTDYVFSGTKNSPWRVDDVTEPTSTYGKSKLAGEVEVSRIYPENSLIIRTAWLYSRFGKNFYKTILNLALKDSNTINVVSDQFGQPTNALDLAELVSSAISNNVPAGIYHSTSSGISSWHEFAVEIFKLAGADSNRIKAISSKDYQAKASRPEFSVLDNSKWLDFGIKPLGPWQESVIRAFPGIYKSLS